MIEIEFNAPSTKTCDCCGQEVVSLTRYVHKDGNAFAVYFISFTRGHLPKVAHGIIGLGEWEDGTGPGDRLAFPFKIWTKGIHYQVGVVDAEESGWRHTTILGRILNRNEALQHSWIKEVFHITDHIVAEDKIVVDYFTTSA